MSKKKNKRNKNKKKNYCIKVIVCLIIFGILGCLGWYLYNEDNYLEITYEEMYVASDKEKVIIYKLVSDEEVKKLVEDNSLYRGNEVSVSNEIVTYEEVVYSKIKIDDVEYYINRDNLVSDKDDIVKEEYVYTRVATSIIESVDDIKINGLAKKGDRLEVVGYDYVDEYGNVNMYKVSNDEIDGYVYGKYMVDNEDEALGNYNSEVYDKIHGNVKNLYGGGDAIKLDFYPNEKVNFLDNVMPSSVYALYLNCSSDVINNIDSYIEFARDTEINAFVVDIKDNGSPAYPADIFKKISPTSYDRSINSYDSYKEAITKLKDAGFYVIGRITVFKDTYYIKDNGEDAIINKNTGEAYLHNGSYWPSAYDRDVWYYNVMLAKEAVEEFGFNEINFDYVRFPDRMNSVKDIVDLGNIYNEDKVEAIQRFVQYAKDVLHGINTYVSIDVFGETTNSTYTTAYGQYWPAISNEADVICGMPYPDHFSANSYGIAKPWNNPYLLMKYWGSYAYDRQQEIETPARVRTWIQAYDVMKSVDSNGISYNAKEVEDEIRGLYEAGLDGGYITWLSNSSLEKYNKQKEAFKIDYRKEYIDD